MIDPVSLWIITSAPLAPPLCRLSNINCSPPTSKTRGEHRGDKGTGVFKRSGEQDYINRTSPLLRGWLRSDPPSTLMSNPDLPPEIIDWIVDFLHDKPDTLKTCCLASKSWVPRTRKHLFASIEFDSAKTVESWKETFPDPSNSPAYYTHTLCFRRAPAVTAAGTGAGGLIQSFSRVARLELKTQNGGSRTSFGKFEKASLIPFHNFSPLKSLCVGSTVLSYSEVFDLIRSFPFSRIWS